MNRNTTIVLSIHIDDLGIDDTSLLNSRVLHFKMT